MHSYDSLSTFPNIEQALKSLSSDPSIDAYIFSNSTNSMVSTSVTQSPGLSPFTSVFKDLITVDKIKVYKPHPQDYKHLVLKAGRSHKQGSVWLVSGNPFDIVGARSYGLKTVWVDRAGGHHGNGRWNNRLGDLAAGGPNVVVNGVDEAVKTIRK
jgi:2-haloacid dehalogenase